MSLNLNFFLVVGSVIISLGIMYVSSSLGKSTEVLNKPSEKKIEYFEKLKDLWKMEMIFAAVGIALLFIIYPIKSQEETIFIKIVSIASLIYVIATCGLSVIKYNKFKEYHYKLINNKK